MRDRYFLCGRMVIFLWLLMLACGCAGKTAGMPPKYLEIIPRTIHETDRIVATAQIDLTTAQGHFPVRAALVLQKPSYLRLEMLPLIGTPDFFLTATPDDMRIFIPSRGEFYSGKPSAENLARFLTFALNIADMVMILSGSYPSLAEQNLSYASYEGADLLRVDMKTSSGPSQTIWMGKNGRIARLVRHDSDGREIYQVQYEDYAPQGSLAEKITIKWTDNVTSVSVKYSDLKIEKATDLSVFELPVPAEIKIIKMN
jgi:hypothetical protein